MKISLALGPRRPLSRQTAWGCLTANLALPGMGSLVAGRRVGYAQLAVAVTSMFLTLILSGPFVVWFLANWSRLIEGPYPFGAMGEMWRAFRWPLLCIGVF